MDKFSFKITIETEDNTGRVLAVYMRVRRGKSATTKEYANGKIFADYDRKGKLLGIEMLAPCRARVLDTIAEDKTARDFFRKNAPRGMLLAA